MGVDYYTCQSCMENFPDCIDYFICGTCENMFCSTKCGGRQYEWQNEQDEDDDQETTTCVLCRKEQVTDSALLYFLLRQFDLSYENAVIMYKEDKNDN